jgi:hypothetical protein
LGGWVGEQRVNQDTCSPERKARLDALGFDWDPYGTDWDQGFGHLQAYVREYKDCRVPHFYKLSNGYRLGGWILKQRQSRDTLSAERKARLDALGFDWDPLTTDWQEGFEHLKAYVQEHGHCRVQLRYKSQDGYPLGSWVGNQRELQDTRSDAEKGQLNSLGFIWNARDALWEEGFEHLRAYVNEVKDCRVPLQYRSPDGHRLGQWVSDQRQARDRLASERKARLDALGFDWNRVTTRWEEGFEHLQAYVNEYKHCRVPLDYRSPDGYRLGQWVHNQRQRPSFVSPERKARFDALGFDWSPQDTAWEKGFRYLTMYKGRERHCRVPQAHKEDGFGLGQWVTRQRNNKDRLSEEQRQGLEKLGFVWNVSLGRSRKSSP